MRNELEARGIPDVRIAVCDGLVGLPGAINAIWPQGCGLRRTPDSGSLCWIDYTTAFPAVRCAADPAPYAASRLSVLMWKVLCELRTAPKCPPHAGHSCRCHRPRRRRPERGPWRAR